MRRDLFEEFCREYVKELNRLRMEHRAKACQALEHEDSRLGATMAIRGLIEAILLEADGEELRITLKATWRGC